MKEIQTLPASVQRLMDHGRKLLAEAQRSEAMGDYDEAESLREEGGHALGEAVKTLATAQPESASLIVLAAMGHQGFEVTDSKKAVEETSKDLYTLGIRTNRDVTTVTKTEASTRRVKAC